MITQALMAVGTSDEAYLSYDPHWGDVVSLLHLNGSNLSKTVTEEVSGADGWTISNASGSAYISTSANVFGGSSLYMEGVNDAAYVTVPDSIVPQFAMTGDFTLEMRVRRESISANTPIAAYARNTGGSGEDGWYLYVGNTTNYLRFRQYTENAGNPGLTVDLTGTALSLNTWHAIAITRSGTTTNMYIDGTRVATASSFLKAAPSYSLDKQMGLGGTPNTPTGWASVFHGYIDEFRLTNAARYTGATYVVRSSAFPNS